MIGKPAERCPWRWDQAQGLVEGGHLSLRNVGHCLFCGFFFDRREGYPRKRATAGGRRFGTKTCESAWRDDQRMARRAEHRTREMIRASQPNGDGRP